MVITGYMWQLRDLCINRGVYLTVMGPIRGNYTGIVRGCYGAITWQPSSKNIMKTPYFLLSTLRQFSGKTPHRIKIKPISFAHQLPRSCTRTTPHWQLSHQDHLPSKVKPNHHDQYLQCCRELSWHGELSHSTRNYHEYSCNWPRDSHVYTHSIIMRKLLFVVLQGAFYVNVWLRHYVQFNSRCINILLIHDYVLFHQGMYRLPQQRPPRDTKLGGLKILFTALQ